MNIAKVLDEEAQASESNPDAPAKPGTQITRGHGRSETLQIRLHVDELALLADLAIERNVPVSTLARDLLLRQLRAQDASPEATIARLRSDLDVLAATVA